MELDRLSNWEKRVGWMLARIALVAMTVAVVRFTPVEVWHAMLFWLLTLIMHVSENQ